MSDDRPSQDGVSVPVTSRPPDAPRVAYLPPEAIPAANHRPDMDGAQRTHPLSFAVGTINGLRNAVLPIAAVLYSMRGESYVLPAALGIGLLVVLLNGGISYLQWRKLTYRVGEADIRVESGIVSRAARSVPYERIQDVSLEQALIPRLLGLVEVRFETGAGGGDELKLSYLTEEEGERLRETVRDRKEAEGPSSAAAASEHGEASAQSEPAARALFAMNPRRVFTFGLFEFSLAVVAVLAGAVQQFDLVIDFDLWEMDRWQELLGGPGTWLAGLGPFAQIASFLVALATLALVGVVTGV
ncbi:MAG: PH domain-containing protein, partial [Alteripontixanthobacter sp.]